MNQRGETAMHVLVRRCIANYGETQAFLEAANRYNQARLDAGLPGYRHLVNSGAGHANEFVFVAEFESAAAIDEADAALDTDAIREPLREMYSHITPATVMEWRLEDVAG